ncbi:MAG: Hint domain-containing protein, partial [Acidobacteriota bacterium]
PGGVLARHDADLARKGANVYQFALNDPANLTDSTGLYAEAVIEAASIGSGLVSLKVNAARGNWKWVAWDLVGLAVDTAALTAPGVPGFVGLGLKAKRAAELGHDVSRFGSALRAGQAAVMAGDAYFASKEAKALYRQGEKGWAAFYGGMALVGAKGASMGAEGILRNRVFSQCFVAGTPVWMADGTQKPIEEVEIGDLVVSRDPETGETSTNRVVHLFVTDDREILELEVETADGSVETFEVTPEHPFFTADGEEVLAKDLREGDRLAPTARGETGLTVRQVRGSPARATVYNFEVENDHTYFVGETGVWVHNRCTGRTVYRQLSEEDRFRIDQGLGIRPKGESGS